MQPKTVIALDGPAGSGKSTVAKHLSRELNFVYLDSGAIYRTLTYFGLQNLSSTCKGREAEIAAWFRGHPQEIRITYQDHTQVMWLSGQDVSSRIRSQEVTRDVRYVSDHPECREFVNNMMRRLAEQHPVVIDGRDIGTRVFPETPHKFYLDARPEVRAQRRARDYGIPTEGEAFEQLLAEILERDAGDMARTIAPLRRADDAILLDTTDMSVAEVAAAIRSRIRF